ncbi:MAG: SUMF1/EgtB/PvdO family nonheme iron enzyme [Chloroflexi bacterium]|nr:SUMF1/EgtB/PvdO family nonheme iron enzyme [Chloroflexota bacterium]
MLEAEMRYPILTDRPADRDGLDFQPYIDSLAELIMDPATRTPLTIGVFGQWGSGKTSLMQLIKQPVDAQGHKSVWFNAWKYEREELALWRVLILRTLDALRPRQENGDPYTLEELTDPGQKALLKDLDRLEQSVYSTVEWTELGKWTVDWAKALEGTVAGATEIALSLVPGAAPLVELLRKARNAVKGDEVAPLTEAFQREAQEFRREQLRSVEQFIDTFEQTIDKHLVTANRRLVVFIDDLDRCLPERTVEVLEAIKLFLDVPGCIFVLGVDPAKVQEGIRLRYHTAPSTADSVNYLEKIIQVPFILPDIDFQDMRGFVEQLQVGFPSPRCGEVFAGGMDPNPRQNKRAINIFLLLWKLAGKRRLKTDTVPPPTDPAAPPSGPLLSEVLTPVRLAKVVVIQHSHPDLYDLLKLTPRYLRDLENYYRERPVERGLEQAKAEAGEIREETARISLPAPLEPFSQRAGLRRLLTLFLDDDAACFRRLSPTELRRYLTLAGRAETERPPEPARSRQAFEPELISIPAGKFSMGSTPEEVKDLGDDYYQVETPQHTVELPAYQIGHYPVTNLEYKAFVEATGHPSPIHWENGQFPDALADHPVVNVSSTGSGDGRRYPWGNDWDKKHANTREAGPGATTPVGQYSPAGDSPEGCADMAGNVWEWTDSWFQPYPGSNYQHKDYGEKVRVVRGGSFNGDGVYARVACRGGRDPLLRNWYLGFRVGVGVAASSSPLNSEPSGL